MCIRDRLRAAQRVVGRILQTQLFPDITPLKCTVKYDNDLDPEFWMALWESSAVSRERVIEEFGIIDDYNTYANDLSIELAEKTAKASPPPTSGTSTNKSTNNDDNSDRTVRVGGRADTSVTKGR